MVIRADRAIAWLIPNAREATQKNLDRYIKSVGELSRFVDDPIPDATGDIRFDKPQASWPIPAGCDEQ